MPELVVVDPELVKEKTNICRRQLQNSRQNFYDEVARRDSPFGSGRLSLEAQIAISSFEHFLGTRAALKQTIYSSQLLKSSQEKEQFVEMFCFAAGAASGALMIEQMRKNCTPLTLAGKRRIDFNKGDFLVLEDLISSYISGTARSTNGETLLSYTKDFYDWIIKEAVEQHKDSKFSSLSQQVEAARIKLNGIVVNGFNYRKFDDKAEAAIWSVKREDYVGNKELLDTLDRAMIELFDYNFKAKKNPNIDADGGFQQTFTIWGEGGTGKTMGIAVVTGEAKEKARQMGIPFFVRELRGFKNEYFGKSAQNIRELFEEMKKGDAIYAVIIEDIDTVFFSREELRNRPEDKDILGEFMNQLEGFTSNPIGNYVLFATSNHPLEGDGPLMDRLRQCQIQVKGPQTPEQYVAVFKAKYRSGINSGYVVVKDWEKVGEFAHRFKLSNRDIRNICLDTLKLTKKYERPENFQSMGYNEQVAYLRTQRRKVGDAEVIEGIKRYVVGIEEQKKKEFDSEVARAVEQYRLRLAVEARIREAK
ncbi:MAG: AAA family ATPase [Candidatus Woesearchaeota archaeon]